MKLLTFILLFTSACAGQEYKAPHSQFSTWNKELWIGEMVTFAAADVLDGRITVSRLGHGRGSRWQYAGEISTPWLYGQHPSALRYGLIEAGTFAAVATLSYKLQHSKRLWMRIAGHAAPIALTYFHTKGAIQNYRLESTAFAGGAQ